MKNCFSFTYEIRELENFYIRSTRFTFNYIRITQSVQFCKSIFWFGREFLPRNVCAWQNRIQTNSTLIQWAIISWYCVANMWMIVEIHTIFLLFITCSDDCYIVLFICFFFRNNFFKFRLNGKRNKIHFFFAAHSVLVEFLVFFRCCNKPTKLFNLMKFRETFFFR